MSLLPRPWPGLAGFLHRLTGHPDRGRGPAAPPESRPHLSLLSVVKQKHGSRYMAVEQIFDGLAECAWVEAGLRRTARFPLSELEVVPALGPDDAMWREAFRAGNHRKVG